MTVTVSYEPFDKLIESLRNDGLFQEAYQLNDMLHETAWTSGSELMGELGLLVKKISKENKRRLSDESKQCVREAMDMVKRVWPGLWW
jgi:hypothetical protein